MPGASQSASRPGRIGPLPPYLTESDVAQLLEPPYAVAAIEACSPYWGVVSEKSSALKN